MAITKETKLVQTEIVGDFKIIQVAYDIIYKEDGVETFVQDGETHLRQIKMFLVKNKK